MQLHKKVQPEKIENEYKKAHLNILLTASWLNLQATKSLKSFHISPQQFNILSILQSFHPAPVTVKVLTERMIDQMSNASRLVEKLKIKGFVEREACDEDRRRVNVFITESGLEVLERATRAFEANLEKHFNHLTPKDVDWLNDLLDQLRG
jgi:DNA-binding MarR family transcriptional regulator